MYILTIYGKETEGAYSVNDEDGEQILYLFEGEDDAMRYAMMLEDPENYEFVKTVEVDPEIAIKTCGHNGLNYAIISPDDFVIPPK